MKIEPQSSWFMATVLLVSLIAHGFLTIAFAMAAGALMAASLGAYVTGSLGYGILQITAIPILLAGYVRAGDFASAESARCTVWLFYGEWVPR
ncbi:hypothetical protein [Rhizobium rhizogenes]|uniref:hypothetical protein n=1 Tax=Rhizobium rhizogenes TaxID=359 RepID=UPI001297A931|nr:hypothetical protein [Rhizobium rhizogenes]MQB34734.1 hypothetical protein [Rhizobium rhizogenes]